MDAAAAAHAVNEIAMQASAAAQSSANVQIAAIIMTGLVTIATLWIKQSYEARKAAAAARLAAEEANKAKVAASATDTKMTEALAKIDDNTAKLQDTAAKAEAIDGKADTIVHRTNGVMDAMHSRVSEVEKNITILARDFLEMKVSNRESTHRLLGAVDALHKMIQEMLVVQRLKNNPA